MRRVLFVRGLELLPHSPSKVSSLAPQKVPHLPSEGAGKRGRLETGAWRTLSLRGWREETSSCLCPHLGETWGWGWGVTQLSPSPVSTGASPRCLLLGLDTAKALGAGGVLCSQQEV